MVGAWDGRITMARAITMMMLVAITLVFNMGIMIMILQVGMMRVTLAFQISREDMEMLAVLIVAVETLTVGLVISLTVAVVI